MKKVLLIPDRPSYRSEIISQVFEMSCGKVCDSIESTLPGYIFVSSEKNDETKASACPEWVVFAGVVPDKQESLILDYAQNFERHAKDGDIFNLSVKAAYSPGESEPIECRCEECSRINLFSPRENDNGFKIDVNGYFCDLAGERILVEAGDKKKPMPAHHGRRCQHINLKTGERCDGWWSYKECLVCEHRNDIAARYCKECRAEIVNPADKLIELHQKHKRDPYQAQCDEILDIIYTNGLSRAGNDMLTAAITTSRRYFTVYLLEHNDYLARTKQFFSHYTNGFTEIPRTITYKKDGDFWKVLGFNNPTDDEILKEKLNG